MVFDGTRFLIGAGLLAALTIVVLVAILLTSRYTRGQAPLQRPEDDDPPTPAPREFPPSDGPSR